MIITTETRGFLRRLGVTYNPLVMGWTFDEIKTDWGCDGAPLPPELLVAAFDRVEQYLGRDWIETSRRSTQGGTIVRGLAPTMRVADMGQKLTVLKSVSGNISQLVHKIQQGDSSAEAELAAIYLLRSRNTQAIVELFPPVDGREPDFRTRLGEEHWTYVEVAKPNKSQFEKQAEQVMVQLTASLQAVSTLYSVEVYLHRAPRETEMPLLVKRIAALSQETGVLQEELPDDLGLLFLNVTPPGRVLKLRIGEEKFPRIGVSAIAGDGTKPNRKISVSMPFCDVRRAGNFLAEEASQLPATSPGLVILEVSSEGGGIKNWGPLLLKCFVPDLYSKVSAVCLLDDAVVTFHASQLATVDTRLITNPHAILPLPPWIAAAVREAGEDFNRVVPQA